MDKDWEFFFYGKEKLLLICFCKVFISVFILITYNHCSTGCLYFFQNNFVIAKVFQLIAFLQINFFGGNIAMH